MQLYALDDEGKRLFVSHAEKGKNYFCIECNARIRLRSGPKKAAHFYHVLPDTKCRLSQKSEQHIRLQDAIRCQIGKDFCDLEVRFDEINRIADVAWYEKKIVFEIQCSPITQEEITARNADYERAGWYVVWLFLDKTFVHRHSSTILSHMQERTFYIANGSLNEFYDMYDTFVVDLSTIEKNCCEQSEDHFPNFLLRRLRTWPYYAKKDLIYYAKHHSDDSIFKHLIDRMRMDEWQQSNFSASPSLMMSILYMIVTVLLDWACTMRCSKK